MANFRNRERRAERFLPHDKLQNKTFQQRFHFYLTKLSTEDTASSKPATASVTMGGKRA